MALLEKGWKKRKSRALVRFCGKLEQLDMFPDTDFYYCNGRREYVRTQKQGTQDVPKS